MRLHINGKIHDFETIPHLQHLLEKLGYESVSVAVALNGRFVPRDQYAYCQLSDGQELEVVAPMQGG